MCGLLCSQWIFFGTVFSFDEVISDASDFVNDKNHAGMKPTLAGWLWFKCIKKNHPNPASEVKVISPSVFGGVGTH